MVKTDSENPRQYCGNARHSRICATEQASFHSQHSHRAQISTLYFHSLSGASLVCICNTHRLPNLNPYHPFRLISLTLATVALKPSLNSFRHLSDLSLFLFMPARSWNICLYRSDLIFSRDTSWPNFRRPTPKSTPFTGFSSIVRPTVGLERTVRLARWAIGLLSCNSVIMS